MKTTIIVTITLLAGIAIGIGIYHHYTNSKAKPDQTAIISNGKIEKAPDKEGFLEIISDAQKIKGGKKLYTGKVIWNEQSGANGVPAMVPVRAMRINKAQKKLVILETKLSNKNGEFDFILPASYEIMLGAVTSKALNMPPKVKKFFKQQPKKQPPMDI